MLDEPATTKDPYSLLQEWLPTYLLPLVGDFVEDDSNLQRLLELSIRDYIRDSAKFDVTAVDRLRYLAIYIEEEIRPFDRFAAWQAAERLYSEAHKLEPNNDEVLTSRAITARAMSHSCTSEQKETMMAVARSASLSATLIYPSAHTFSVAAECHYGVDAKVSMVCAESAIEIDPEAPWPLLWKAYCLHDLERYDEAIAAYRSVPSDFFEGPVAWRMILLAEQVASCLWKAGKHDEAYFEFDRILTRYEIEPHLAELRYVKEAVVEWPQFHERIEAIEKVLPK